MMATQFSHPPLFVAVAHPNTEQDKSASKTKETVNLCILSERKLAMRWSTSSSNRAKRALFLPNPKP